MASPASLLVIPFREVRHSQPDDGVHYEALGVRGRQHGWELPAHCHEDLHQFNFLASGSVVATIDGTRYALNAPAAWMVAPRVMHGFVYEEDSQGDLVSVPSGLLQTALSPSAGLWQRLAQAMVVDAGTASGEIDELHDLFGRVGREFNASRPGRSEALQAHVALLALWFARCESALSSQGGRRGQQDALVERYRTLIETNLHQHWPVRRYAAELGVSADHLSRRCRAVTGLSALDLAQERQLLEARRLLAYTGATVSDIARALGFDDPAYFSRAFARGVGQSPIAYRSALAEGLATPPADR
jgi:AraC family transcriptional regulator, transcriptional activator of pobA